MMEEEGAKMMRNREHALEYAKRGWELFPVYEAREGGGCSCGGRGNCSPGKHPRLANGFKGASSSSEQIVEWWTEWPEANIGIRTGERSGLVVLDVDLRSGGTEALEALEREIGPLPATLTVQSGGGGWHYYFKHPASPLRGRVGFRPGLDLKAEGGYVIAPPSLHESGLRYRWKKGHSPGVGNLAESPTGLLQILQRAGDINAPPVPVDHMEAIPEGRRNDTLAQIAGFFRSQGLEAPEYIPVLHTINEQRCQPPLPSSEVERIGYSVSRYPPGRGTQTAPSRSSSDLGNARRLADAHREDLRYVYGWGKWLVWDGSRWKEDCQGQVVRGAKRVPDMIREEAWACSDSRDRKDLLRWATISESKVKIDAMISLAQSEPGVAITPDGLFGDPLRLPVRNGVIDLRTGDLHPRKKEDMVTTALAVDFNPDAPAPRWKSFLKEITNNDIQLQRYLQRAAGYSLTGRVNERCLFVLVGEGANGKSTLLRTLLGLLGPFGTQAEPKLLLSSKWEQHPTNVADLSGKRFVVAVEADGRRTFDHALLKQITGGDMLKARYMRQDFFEFSPTHKIWLATNVVPEIDPQDQAMWDRVRIIPFDVRFEPKDQDRDLLAKLEEEKEGVLAWAVRGCVEWQGEGLGEPPAVIKATQQVREDMDPVGRFLQEECAFREDESVEATRLFEAYRIWCERQEEGKCTQKSFGAILTKKGLRRGRCPSSNRVVYQGLVLAEDPEDSNDSST